MKNKNLKAIVGLVLAIVLVVVMGYILKLTNNIQSGGGIELDAKLTDRRRWRGMARLHTGSNPVLTTNKTSKTMKQFIKQLLNKNKNHEKKKCKISI